MPLNIDLVIFDCDGVLVDSEVVPFRIFRECLAELGVALTLEEAMLCATRVASRYSGEWTGWRHSSTRISFESCGAIRRQPSGRAELRFWV